MSLSYSAAAQKTPDSFLFPGLQLVPQPREGAHFPNGSERSRKARVHRTVLLCLCPKWAAAHPATYQVAGHLKYKGLCKDPAAGGEQVPCTDRHTPPPTRASPSLGQAIPHLTAPSPRPLPTWKDPSPSIYPIKGHFQPLTEASVGHASDPS